MGPELHDWEWVMELVDQTVASWNHIRAFLRRIEAFRDACRERRSARFVPPPLRRESSVES